MNQPRNHDGASAGSSALRYARQAALPQMGEAGQKRIGQASVLLIGCGALGSTQAELLARAGIGRLILTDRDIVEWHNLPRQNLYDEHDVRERRLKALAAERRIRAINEQVTIEPHVLDVTADNIAELVRDADVILDATDNFATRFLLNDAAVAGQKAWVYGGVLGTSGNVMAVLPGQGPCLRCLMPDLPPREAYPTCETAGVLNAAVAWVAALQVAKALRFLVAPAPLPATLHVLDVWEGAAQVVNVNRKTSCTCCEMRVFEFLHAPRQRMTTTVLCGSDTIMVTPEASIRPDFNVLMQHLAQQGRVTTNGAVLEFCSGPCRLVVFQDGRTLVHGARDEEEAIEWVDTHVLTRKPEGEIS